MSHREKSLTPWITNDPDSYMTDEQKHAWCIERTGFPAVFIPPSLYREAKRTGHDMRYFIEQQPILTSACVQRDGELYRVEHKMPTSKQMRDAITDKLDRGEPLGANHVPEPPDHLRYAAMKKQRKHISEKYCGGVTCLPGLGGKCVACSEDD